MLKKLYVGTAAVIGAAAMANGLYMLASPEYWYLWVPGVTTTGPFNQHFIRDIGLIYLFVGTAFLVGATMARYRVVLWGASTAWLAAHAIFHSWEVAVGICEPYALARDFPLVTLPAIIGAVLTLLAAYHHRTSTSDLRSVKAASTFAR
jgi:hypothetical protein